ncbi:heme-binding protein [Mucilaginibacter sp. AW1-3]
MSEASNHPFTGARILSPAEAENVNIGPLAKLIGKWQGLVPADQSNIASGWNVISVPGPGRPNFTYEVIPYTENLTFSPAVIQAGNRGPVIDGNQVDQNIYGLMYEQEIISACPADAFSSSRGFIAGTPIHAETGLILLLGTPNGGYTIARLSTIPHGNALLALGASSVQNNPGTDFIPKASAIPTNIDGTAVGLLDYVQQITPNTQFPGIFNQVDPNTFLTSTLKDVVGTGSITSMTTFTMDTRAPNTDGGILNIPFIASNVTATSMDAIFWVEEIEGGTETELLQYTQTINLVFPPAGLSLPITWPHITVNTLVRV